MWRSTGDQSASFISAAPAFTGGRIPIFHPNGAGLIYAPGVAHVLCGKGGDSGGHCGWRCPSINNEALPAPCARDANGAERCWDYPGDGCGGSWSPADFGGYLHRQAAWQIRYRRLQYNEIIVDGDDATAHLPDSVDAIFYTVGGAEAQRALALADGSALTVDASALTQVNFQTVLRDLNTQLVASPSVLAKAEEQGQSADALARESLLCTRCVAGLSKVRVGPSTIQGAGDGVFATTDIAEDEIITCYPGDAVMARVAGDGIQSERGRDRVTIWGMHVPAELRAQSNIDMEAYGLTVDMTYSIVGMPTLQDDPSYVGHLINDGAQLCGLGGPEIGMMLPAYLEQTKRRRNAGHRTLEGCHTVTFATRDIAAGEELYVTYGATYWTGRMRRRNERISHALAGFL